jgi:hypothetical protein
MSRRRRKPARTQPRTPFTLPPPTTREQLTLADLEPLALTHPQPSTDVHRLAVIADGNNGNVGSRHSDSGADPADLLREAAALLQQRPRPANDDLEALRAAREETRRRIDEAWDLALAAADLADAEWDERVLRRRVERHLGALQRRARIEEQRAAGGMYAHEIRTPNRPTHVDVDPGAWSVVKQRAFERGLLVGTAVADLVVRTAECGFTGQRNPQQPRSASHRFARLFVDDETWRAFRARAVEAEVTVARLLGLVVETEAGRLGWRAEVDQ